MCLHTREKIIPKYYGVWRFSVCQPCGQQTPHKRAPFQTSLRKLAARHSLSFNLLSCPIHNIECNYASKEKVHNMFAAFLCLIRSGFKKRDSLGLSPSGSQ